MKNDPMPDIELMASWNAARIRFENAAQSLQAKANDPAVREACLKESETAMAAMLELGQEATRRRLILVRQPPDDPA